MAAAVITIEDLLVHLRADFPEAFNERSGLSIVEIGHGTARLRRDVRPGALRPGGTISGPVLMALADVSMYIAILGAIGWVPLAVTTNLNINFLKKPAPGPLIADARLHKLGKRLAVGEIAIRSEGDEELVAHATATYSIPSRA